MNGIPGYDEAIARETEAREIAWLEQPYEIAGLPARALTLRLLILLITARNAFVCGGVRDNAEVLQFLWVVSPEFKPGNVKARDAFYARLHGRNLLELRRGIDSFLEIQLMDRPPASGVSGAVSYWSWPVRYVDRFGERYGWSLAETLDCPLPILFQLDRRVEAEKSSNPMLFNSLSDKAMGDFLRSLETAKEEAP